MNRICNFQTYLCMFSGVSNEKITTGNKGSLKLKKCSSEFCLKFTISISKEAWKILSFNVINCIIYVKVKINSILIVYLDQTVVCLVIQVLPCALFPVLIGHRTSSPRTSTCSSLSALPFLAACTLDTMFSLWSLQSRSSHWSSPSRGSLISVTTITSIPSWYPWGTRLAMCTGLTCTTEGRWLRKNRNVWYARFGLKNWFWQCKVNVFIAFVLYWHLSDG